MRREVSLLRGTVGEASWETASRPLPRLLRPHVRRVVGYDERRLGGAVQRQFPEPFVVLIIEFGPPIEVIMRSAPRRFPGGFVAGLSDAFADTAHDGHQRGVQVDLTPTGARRVFGRPLSELGPQVVSLRDLLPRAAAHLDEQLATRDDWSDRLDLVEHFLIDRLVDCDLDTRATAWALAQIESHDGTIPIGALARELGWSHRRLIAAFKDEVGATPKLVARLVRFNAVMRAARGPGPVRWAEVAARCGFSDQAHLSREIRQLTGLDAKTAQASFLDLADLIG